MITFKDRMGSPLTTDVALKKIITRIYNWWLDFELMLLRWVGHIPSHAFRKFFYILSGIKLGHGAVIHMWANFFQPKNISIGEDSTIGDHVFLDGRATLSIGNHVDIASSVMIYNSEHDLNSEDFDPIYGEVEIGDYV